MSVIPTYDRRQLTAPMPGVRRPTGFDAGSFGGNVARELGQLGGAVRELGQGILHREAEKIEKNARLEKETAERAMNARVMQAVNDHETRVQEAIFGLLNEKDPAKRLQGRKAIEDIDADFFRDIEAQNPGDPDFVNRVRINTDSSRDWGIQNAIKIGHESSGILLDQQRASMDATAARAVLADPDNDDVYNAKVAEIAANAAARVTDPAAKAEAALAGSTALAEARVTAVMQARGTAAAREVFEKVKKDIDPTKLGTWEAKFKAVGDAEVVTERGRFFASSDMTLDEIDRAVTEEFPDPDRRAAVFNEALRVRGLKEKDEQKASIDRRFGNLNDLDQKIEAGFLPDVASFERWAMAVNATDEEKVELRDRWASRMTKAARGQSPEEKAAEEMNTYAAVATLAEMEQNDINLIRTPAGQAAIAQLWAGGQKEAATRYLKLTVDPTAKTLYEDAVGKIGKEIVDAVFSKTAPTEKTYSDPTQLEAARSMHEARKGAYLTAFSDAVKAEEAKTGKPLTDDEVRRVAYTLSYTYKDKFRGRSVNSWEIASGTPGIAFTPETRKALADRFAIPADAPEVLAVTGKGKTPLTTFLVPTATYRENVDRILQNNERKLVSVSKDANGRIILDESGKAVAAPALEKNAQGSWVFSKDKKPVFGLLVDEGGNVVYIANEEEYVNFINLPEWAKQNSSIVRNPAARGRVIDADKRTNWLLQKAISGGAWLESLGL